MKRLPFIAALIFISLVILPATAMAAAPSPNVFSATASYPTEVYTGETFQIYINATYGFRNYTVGLIFSAKNLSGISPGASDKLTNVSDPYFVVNVTAPSTPESLTIYVSVFATGYYGNESYYTTLNIGIYQPMVLTATVSNPTPTYMYNVTVTFYLDSFQVASSVIKSIAPHSRTVVNETIVHPIFLRDGYNTLTIKVSNSAALINNAVQYTTRFYYGKPPNYTWIYYVAAAVLIFMVILVLAAGRRSSKLGPKWKK